MTTSFRTWWRNCALEADSEIIAIDRMEDHIAPIDPNVARIRELISGLELCHHKVERWGGRDEKGVSLLEVPQEFIKMKDLRVRSQRLSEEVEKKFDKLLEKYPEYSKTTLINLALLEFAERYL